jgi:hypothetical protein
MVRFNVGYNVMHKNPIERARYAMYKIRK